jgi:hypothetical protein
MAAGLSLTLKSFYIMKTYDNFPFWIVILSNSVSIGIYLSGLMITFSLSWIAAILYLVLILALEYRLLSKHCINCYYWGKICGFGKGRLSSFFFKKGNPLKFCENSFTWKDMIPDLLVFLLPFIIALILLIIKFNLAILLSVIILISLATIGNGFIRGNLTCKYCKQRETGCPAEQLFSKNK